MKSKVITVILWAAPFERVDFHNCCEKIERWLKDGFQVNIFGYHNGVFHFANNLLVPPEKPHIAEKWQNLKTNFPSSINYYVCLTACLKRGLATMQTSMSETLENEKELLFPNINVVGVASIIESIIESGKIIEIKQNLPLSLSGIELVKNTSPEEIQEENKQRCSFLFDLQNPSCETKLIDWLDLAWSAIALGQEVHLKLGISLLEGLIKYKNYHTSPHQNPYQDLTKKLYSAPLFGIENIYFIEQNRQICQELFGDEWLKTLQSNIENIPQKDHHQHIFIF